MHRGKERGKANAAIGYSLRPQRTDRARRIHPVATASATDAVQSGSYFLFTRASVFGDEAEQSVLFVSDSGGEKDAVA